MKTVFNNNMVAHVWAQQNQQSGRSNNGQFYFEGAVIYSYGQHFPIARFVEHRGKRAVLFTTRSYSITTTGHIHRVRRALPKDIPVFHVYNPLSNHTTLRAEYEKALEDQLQKAGNNRRKAAEWFAMAHRTVEDANRYAAFFSQRWRLKLTDDIVEAIDGAKDRIARAQKREAARKRRIEIANRVRAAKELDEFRRGERRSVYSDEIAMRVSDDKIETSLGAVFPVEHGKRAFRLIAQCRRVGEGWQRNGHAIHLGHFQIDRIEPNGDVKAGCHFVKWQEIERIAGELGLLDAPAVAC